MTRRLLQCGSWVCGHWLRLHLLDRERLVTDRQTDNERVALRRTYLHVAMYDTHLMAVLNALEDLLHTVTTTHVPAHIHHNVVLCRPEQTTRYALLSCH